MRVSADSSLRPLPRRRPTWSPRVWASLFFRAVAAMRRGWDTITYASLPICFSPPTEGRRLSSKSITGMRVLLPQPVIPLMMVTGLARTLCRIFSRCSSTGSCGWHVIDESGAADGSEAVAILAVPAVTSTFGTEVASACFSAHCAGGDWDVFTGGRGAGGMPISPGGSSGACWVADFVTTGAGEDQSAPLWKADAGTPSSGEGERRANTCAVAAGA